LWGGGGFGFGGKDEVVNFSFETGGDDGLEENIVPFVVLGEDFAFTVEEGDEVLTGLGDAEVELKDPIEEQLVHAMGEEIEAFGGLDGDAEGGGEVGLELVEAGGVVSEEINFIDDDEDAFFVGTEFGEDNHGGFEVVEDIGIGGVEDVDEEVGEDGFFEGGFEGLDEAVGEVANEADGVGEEEGLAVGQFDFARGGVQGGEDLVFDVDLGAGQLVEEGGFAGVGVSDDGSGGDGGFEAFLALGIADFDDVGEFGLDAIDAFAGDAAVDFDLFFAFAAGGAFTAFATAGAAALAVEVGPHAGESGEGVFHAGEVDLEAGFAGVGAQVEDIEDDFLAIDGGEIGFFFPGALLGGGEFVVEDDAIAVEFFGELHGFVGFAFAHEVSLVGVADEVADGFDDADVEGFDEFAEFFEEGFGFGFAVALEVGADEEGALDHFGFFSDVEHSYKLLAISDWLLA
jgi:hypothetical protein